MLLKRTTDPEGEPVTLAAAKQHLRVLHATEDALIERLIKTAREHIESRTGRALLAQGWTLWLPGFPKNGVITLPKPPLIDVASISYIDTDGMEQTLSSEAYRVDPEDHLNGTVQRKRGHEWPETAADDKAVEIVFTAGYGDEAKTPGAIQSALLLLIEHFYHNRGETGDGPITANPIASQHLLGPYMTHGWR